MANKADIALHYDGEVEFFYSMLGKTMAYSCGVFPDAGNEISSSSLDEAQIKKLNKIMSFAGINSTTSSIVDFGCGWGSMINHLESKYPEASVTGVTISESQANYCKQVHPNAKIIEADVYAYLEQNKDSGFMFDSAVSIGAIEHFASPQDYKNKTHIDRYRQFFEGTSRIVKGNLGLQSIISFESASDQTKEERKLSFKAWRYITKYIFPNTLIPPLDALTDAMKGIYQINRQEINTIEYPQTLRLWGERLELMKEDIDIDHYNLYRKYIDYCINCLGGNLTISRFSLSPIRR